MASRGFSPSDKRITTVRRYRTRLSGASARAGPGRVWEDSIVRLREYRRPLLRLSPSRRKREYAGRSVTAPLSVFPYSISVAVTSHFLITPFFPALPYGGRRN